MQTVFKKIKSKKISEKIAAQIRDLIKNGELKPGEMLPPERVFAKILGTGRSSLREAINIIETQGFVKKCGKKGIFVGNLTTSIISDPLRLIFKQDQTKLIQLHEIRKDIELASAKDAAEQSTSVDIEKMKQTIQKMEAKVKDGTLNLYDDFKFHIAIAQSGQNIFRNHILKNIFDIFDDHFQDAIPIMTNEKDTFLEQHQNIFASIAKQDSYAAINMMAEHLFWVEQKLKAFIKL